jgi:hypothetical protein
MSDSCFFFAHPWQIATAERIFQCDSQTEISDRPSVKGLSKYIHMLVCPLVISLMNHKQSQRLHSWPLLRNTEWKSLLPWFTLRGPYIGCSELDCHLTPRFAHIHYLCQQTALRRVTPSVSGIACTRLTGALQVGSPEASEGPSSLGPP